MKVGALIPCRKGSKGIPNKNFKDFCGVPLWAWTYDAAQQSKLFDKIILSSDGGFHANFASNLECSEKFKYGLFDKEKQPPNLILDDNRPEEFSDDRASLDDLLVYYSHKYPEIDLWCLLQPTSPLRTSEDIQKAYAMMMEKETKGDDYKYDSLVSVRSHHVFGWVANAVGIPGVDESQPMAIYPIRKRPNRQDRKDWYLENGAIYFSRKYVIERMKCRLHGFVGLYVMPEDRSLEIDSVFDWKIAEFAGKLNGLA